MDAERRLITKADALGLLRRVGIPEETILALDTVLDDPVDLERDASLLARYGITRGQLVEDMGGSP